MSNEAHKAAYAKARAAHNSVRAGAAVAADAPPTLDMGKALEILANIQHGARVDPRKAQVAATAGQLVKNMKTHVTLQNEARFFEGMERLMQLQAQAW